MLIASMFVARDVPWRVSFEIGAAILGVVGLSLALWRSCVHVRACRFFAQGRCWACGFDLSESRGASVCTDCGAAVPAADDYKPDGTPISRVLENRRFGAIFMTIPYNALVIVSVRSLIDLL